MSSPNLVALSLSSSLDSYKPYKPWRTEPGRAQHRQPAERCFSYQRGGKVACSSRCGGGPGIGDRPFQAKSTACHVHKLNYRTQPTIPIGVCHGSSSRGGANSVKDHSLSARGSTCRIFAGTTGHRTCLPRALSVMPSGPLTTD